MPFEERDGRWEEALEIVLQTWRDGRICYEGKYWTIPETELFPKPVQRPHPPAFLMVTRSDDSVRFAGERLLPMILGQGPDWDEAKHKLEVYRQSAEEAGHDRERIEATMARIGQLKQVHVGPITAQARAEYEKGLMWYFAVRANRGMFGYSREAQPYDYYLQHRSTILGTPEQVADQIEEYRAYTGVNNIICWFNCGGQPREQVRRSMESFAGKVMPRFQ